MLFEQSSFQQTEHFDYQGKHMKESDVRDFIANNFSSFIDYITNYRIFDNDLSEETQSIINGGASPEQILISDLVKLSVIDKLKLAIPILRDLKLIDKEFQLLKTNSGRGKQPSVDIMAYNTENYCLALIELKISDSAEREAITELSAYNQGLQNNFRGLSSLEVIWIPISTEWRVTTKSAVEFTMLWQNTLVMPLKMLVEGTFEINKVTLECFNPTRDLCEIDCLNLFSDECFQAFEIYTKQNILDREAFISYITTICSRLKINGFIIFHKPVDDNYSYGFTLSIYNPYKGYLHKKLLHDFIANYRETKCCSHFKGSGVINTNYTDIDFKTEEIKCFEPTKDDMDGISLSSYASWKKDFLSVGDFAENAENPNINFIVDRITQIIDSNGRKSKALGVPNFETLFTQLSDQSVDSVMYLGVHFELISKKIIIEHQRGHHNDDFFLTIASFPYLRKTFEQYKLK
ncbi:MAG: hypothetical protein JNN25_07510 [Candidatus Kapabacteria bacterium]|nr:hypothetical protein [Candidatus Kapabacteria bacterium]